LKSELFNILNDKKLPIFESEYDSDDDEIKFDDNKFFKISCHLIKLEGNFEFFINNDDIFSNIFFKFKLLKYFIDNKYIFNTMLLTKNILKKLNVKTIKLIDVSIYNGIINIYEYYIHYFKEYSNILTSSLDPNRYIYSKEKEPKIKKVKMESNTHPILYLNIYYPIFKIGIYFKDSNENVETIDKISFIKIIRYNKEVYSDEIKNNELLQKKIEMLKKIKIINKISFFLILSSFFLKQKRSNKDETFFHINKIYFLQQKILLLFLRKKIN
jgi:hypothetical protein